MLDATDQRILARLAVDGRESWAQLARALGLSESKVARRAQRLFRSGWARVVAVPDPLRCGFGVPALVHLRCAPGHGQAVAERLAARPDTRLVILLAGAFDVVVEVITADRGELARVIHRDLREVDGVLAASTESVLRTMKIGYDWANELLGDRPAAPRRRPPAPGARGAGELSRVDLNLIGALSEDGRLSYAALAERLRITESMAARRLRHLVDGGYLTFSPLINPALLGYHVEAFIRMRVEPRRLDEVARRLCRETSVRYLSLTAGASDLVCEAVLRDDDAVCDFLTSTVAPLGGVREVETAIELGTIKRAHRPRPGAVAAQMGER